MGRDGVTYGNIGADKIGVDRFRQILTWPLIYRPAYLCDLEGSAPDGWHQMHEEMQDVGRNFFNFRSEKHWERVYDLLDHLGPEPGTLGSGSGTLGPEPGTGDRRAGGDITSRWPTASDFEKPSRASDKERIASDPGDRRNEYAYFFDFVQSHLFERGERATDCVGKRDIFLYRRTDIDTCTVDLMVPGSAPTAVDRALTVLRFNLCVDRINLYLFSSGVAVLAVEVSGKRDCLSHLVCEDGKQTERPVAGGLTVAHVQRFQNFFRRIYAPYYNPEHFSNAAARLRALGFDRPKTAKPLFLEEEVPLQVLWSAPKSHPAGSAPLRDGFLTDRPGADLREWPQHGERRIDVLPYWNDVLPGRISEAFRAEPPNRCPWRSFSDDRLPSMLFVALDPKMGWAYPPSRLLPRHDWIRLCFADADGASDPYEPTFLADFEKENCYDRFWHLGTRYLFSGYSFAGVMTADGFSKTLEKHFRRHYFQLGLLNVMELATQIGISSRITEIVKAYQSRGNSSSWFGQAIIRVRQDFQQYVHRFRFHGVSSQMQPREMQALWRGRMGVDDIFGEVKEELETASEYAFATEQQVQADTGSYLAVIATLFAVVTLPTAILGMNVIFGNGLPQELLAPLGVEATGAQSPESASFALEGRVFLLSVSALAFLAWVGVQSFETKSTRHLRSSRFLKRALLGLAGLALGVGAALPHIL